MDLRQLEYFTVCAQKGSLTRAAEELYTTQPHVSQVIGSLERELGVKLFRRTGSGIRLTEEGERIRFYAVNALKNADLVRETAAEGAGRSLRLAANPSSRLALRVGEFFSSDLGADMSLQYTECGIEQMMDLLQNRQYALGLLFLPGNRLGAFSHMAERRQLLFTPLLETDLVVHGGPLSPFYGRETVPPEELDGVECIQLEDDFFSVEDLLLEHEAFRSRRWAARTRIRTNSDHLMLRMLRETALCNIGSYGQKSIGDGALTFARVRGFEGTVTFGYLHSGSRLLSDTESAFLRSVREVLAGE